MEFADFIAITTLVLGAATGAYGKYHERARPIVDGLFIVAVFAWFGSSIWNAALLHARANVFEPAQSADAREAATRALETVAIPWLFVGWIGCCTIYLWALPKIVGYLRHP